MTLFDLPPAPGPTPRVGGRPISNPGRSTRTREKDRLASARRRDRIKPAAIAAYGGACACCGEASIEFLVIDHVHGGGNEHRRQTGRVGAAMYGWLKRAGWPPGFQVLCHNCNFALGAFGSCPHDSARKAAS